MNATFLATTALEEFWDKSSPILFLGEWCLLHDRKTEWERLESSVLAYPLQDPRRRDAAFAYAADVYERVLAALSGRLNEIHKASFSPRYWRIVLGPWLLHYVQLLYDRYLCVSAAMQERPVRTIGLEAASYFTPADFTDLQSCFHLDSYNLQLYTQLGDILGMEISSRRAALVRPDLPRAGLKQKTKTTLKRLSASLSPARRLGPGKVWFFNTLIPRRTRTLLALKTRGAALPADFLTDLRRINAPSSPPHPARAHLADLAFSKEEFPATLAKTLPVNLPWTFLEGYAEMRERVRPFLPSAPKAMAVTSWLYDSPYLFLSAELAETRETRLISVQHGGSFGMARYSPVEEHEQRVADEYWSWGWEDGLAGKARPVASFLPHTPRPVREGSILYCGNSLPRYAYRFWSNPLGPQWSQVLDWKHRWIKNLHHEAFSRLRVRPYPTVQYLWRERERLQEEFPDLRFSPPNQGFDDALAECALFVTDTNHTTLLQSLALDKPSVLFWDPALNELRETAQPLFDGLRDAGVLHDSPEEAARKVNEIHRAPLKWWNQANIQSAVETFRNRFAGISTDPVKDWSRELLRLSAT